MKVQFGCGSNFLEGWKNHDSDVDITKKLPYPDESVDIVFCEHCIEHIEYEQFVFFTEECFRILKEGGRIRLATPCIDKIVAIKDKDYIDFACKRFSRRPSTYANMINIMLTCHGHKFVYDKETLELVLSERRFKKIKFYNASVSDVEELCNLEHHWRKIGKKFNDLETIAIEAIKPKKY